MKICIARMFQVKLVVFYCGPILAQLFIDQPQVKVRVRVLRTNRDRTQITSLAFLNLAYFLQYIGEIEPRQ